MASFMHYSTEFKQDMDREGLVVDVDSDRIAYRLLLDNPFDNNTSSSHALPVPHPNEVAHTIVINNNLIE